MNNTIKTILISLASALAVALIVVGLSGSGTKLGAQVQNDLFYFNGGIKVGSSGQFAVSNLGVVTSAGSANTGSETIAGNESITGTLSVTGTTTLKAVAINESTTTTAVIGTSNTGCIKMGNSNGSTTVPVYITVTGSTITASTTKPGTCK